MNYQDFTAVFVNTYIKLQAWRVFAEPCSLIIYIIEFEIMLQILFIMQCYSEFPLNPSLCSLLYFILFIVVIILLY